MKTPLRPLVRRSGPELVPLRGIVREGARMFLAAVVFFALIALGLAL